MKFLKVDKALYVDPHAVKALYVDFYPSDRKAGEARRCVTIDFGDGSQDAYINLTPAEAEGLLDTLAERISKACEENSK